MLDGEVTVYSAVLNERASIDELVQSLLRQTHLPDEILFVDGGSKDGTLERLSQYESKHSIIRVIRAPGTNIAQARNIAFRNARGNVIASIDGGCVARPDWLERLLGALGNDIDIVAGVYVADARTDWDSVIEEFFYPPPAALPDEWKEPSHRSVLLRKRVWEELGPFPEYLYRSEDSWFNKRAEERGMRFRTARDAVVSWKPRANLKEVFRNSYSWVKSDIMNGVRMPFERNRAIRITLRLLRRVVLFDLWILATLQEPVAGLLTLPMLLLVLSKYPIRTRSAKKVWLYNLVDYAVMMASASGLFVGQLTRLLKRKTVYS
jgi:glycosyltransferase involved in cell wall biosynthesis